ncbi:hypothetical protein SPRG_20174 [Saprolegnia parasitica CBS 223.65]|uniref:Uncharacterized protein n=1 Tax=Saprolegnia parasitica (strain CBS 223.65) TaxID=695850 RepID=A0A067CFQ2_SAPPC|nr:hypothetical protein SPRG_20174 [Saprolegnia parasitica CBS 223.65]KDO28010.1 hypothetical protein SPRG_20174 [Saprolegnia parasitica CBS 223.65]|eukprot:XP_012201168.1 hypothetical protein SPRG_20174 [Saprolegnia parasitica CBS 223.65]
MVTKKLRFVAGMATSTSSTKTALSCGLRSHFPSLRSSQERLRSVVKTHSFALQRREAFCTTAASASRSAIFGIIACWKQSRQPIFSRLWAPARSVAILSHPCKSFCRQ